MTYERHTPYTLSNWLVYLSHAEIDFLTQLAEKLPPRPLVINIGAGGGTSGLTFLTARDDLYLTTIDVVKERNPLGGLENELGILEASGVSFVGRHTQIQGDSKEVGREWMGDYADLVFIDGDHTYEGCAGDIEAWWPNLRTGGIMAIHDYKKIAAYALLNPVEVITPEIIGAVIKPYAGVDKAVDDLLLNSKTAQYINTVNTLIAFRKV